MQIKPEKIDVHNVPVNVSNMDMACREVEALIESGKPSYVCFFEANLFYNALKNPELVQVLQNADLVYPDGIAVIKAMKYLHNIDAKRVPGPSFILKACEYGLERNWRHFFLGGGEGVADKLAKNLQARYPNLQVAGCYSPPFRPLNNEEFVALKKQIEESSTTLLWVALGGPKQEFWMSQYLGKIDVPAMLGVGAAFDFHSGNRPWAPVIIRKLGLEWLYRALSGGRATAIRNIKCVSKVGMVLLGDRLRSLMPGKKGRRK